MEVKIRFSGCRSTCGAMWSWSRRMILLEMKLKRKI